MVAEDRHGQRLALEIVLRLTPPLPEPVSRIVVPLVADPKFPAPLCLNVAVRILQSAPAGSPLALELLHNLIDGINPQRAAERLRFLSLHLPKHPDVGRLAAELEHQTEIACPRCGVRLQRPELIVHLWQAHRLLMEGSRARDPWKMIEGWLSEYAHTGRRELLERSCELGQQLDPAEGLTRVHRLLLIAGLTDEEAEENLTAQAEGRRASLCPHCYALVPPEHEPLPPPMNLSRGRIAGGGCTVEVSDRYAFTRLYAATTSEVLHDGPEPGHGLTQRGQTIFFAGPLALIALGLAILLPASLLPPLTPVSLVLLAALVVYLQIRRKQLADGDPARRAIDYAWRFIAPRMHWDEYDRKDSRFLARLAVTSIGSGSPAVREKSLERVTKADSSGSDPKKSAPCGGLAALALAWGSTTPFGSAMTPCRSS